MQLIVLRIRVPDQVLLSEFLQVLAEQGTVAPEEVAELQIITSIGEPVDRAGAETILAVDMTLHRVCPEWEDFLKNTVITLLIGENRLLSVDNANWLMRSISRNGVVDDHERFELLVRVIEQSQNAPEPLILLALQQVVEAVVNGQGPLAYLKPCDRSIMSRTDVDMVRRILVNARDYGNVPLSTGEMAILFELNEQTLPHANHPSWQKLFAQAMSNFMLSDHEAMTQDRASAFQDKSDDTIDAKIDMFLNQFEESGLLASEQNEQSGQEDPFTMAVTDAPAHWIVKRLRCNLAFHDDDAGLLNYVSRLAALKQNPHRALAG